MGGINFGLFGGRTLNQKQMVRKVEQTNNSATIKATDDTGRYQQKDNPLVQTPRGSGLTATSGDSPVSHVTPDSVTLTPEFASRRNETWEGNVTGNTVSRSIDQRTAVLHVEPRFGIGRGGVDVTLFRHDAPIPSLISAADDGVNTVDPSTKDLSTIDFTTKNPQTTQNQDPNPRTKSLVQGA